MARGTRSCRQRVRAPPSHRGRGDVAGEVALVGQQVDDLRSRGGFEIVGPGQRRAVVRGGLPVCAECSGLPRGLYREALHGVVVGGTDRMMHEACEDPEGDWRTRTIRPAWFDAAPARGEAAATRGRRASPARAGSPAPGRRSSEVPRPPQEGAPQWQTSRWRARCRSRLAPALRRQGPPPVALRSAATRVSPGLPLARWQARCRQRREQLRHEERVPVRERKHGSSIVGVTRDTRHGFDRQRLKLEAKRRSQGARRAGGAGSDRRPLRPRATSRRSARRCG